MTAANARAEAAMTVKDVVELIHTGVETAAIIVGGVWAWRAFFRGRLRFPRICVEHAVTHRRFGSSSYLVHVSLIVENRGEVLLRVRSMIVRVQQVLPEPDALRDAVDAGMDPVAEGQREIEWPLLQERTNTWKHREHEIEPGETERIECDFFIPEYVRTIEVYSYIQNDSKRGRDIGWSETTFYDLVEPSVRNHEEQAEPSEDRRASATREASTAAGSETRAETTVDTRAAHEEVAAEGR